MTGAIGPEGAVTGPSSRGRLWLLGGLAVCSITVLALAPLVGLETIRWEDVFSPESNSTGSIIFWRIRIPRVLTAFLAGCGLAASGMAFQAMFRNPLAAPFTLGVASGASLGAALSMRFGLGALLGSMSGLLAVSGTTAGAFLGACTAIALVYGLSRVRQGFSTATMLLAGIAVSFFFSSLISFVHYTSDPYSGFRIVRWLMGGLTELGYEELCHVGVLVAGGVTILYVLSNELNLLATGEDIATSRGVAVNRTKTMTFFATSLMVGGIVAVCGPIGFVGMMVPHMCRLMVGPDHRYLLGASVLFGGVFLLVCDTVARTIIAPTELPVGMITAFLGGPFFLWLLVFRARDRLAW